jgi:uncharacterized protein (DUF2141 family)
MKVRTTALALLAGLAISASARAEEGCEGARTANAGKISVVVSGVRSSQGEVALTLYPDDKRRFLAKGGKFSRVRTRAQATVRACFWVPAGGYALAIYHDNNGDRDFNRTLVGLPAEGFGFSNNPETKVGLPPLSAVRFAVAAGAERSLSIQMRYLR